MAASVALFLSELRDTCVAKMIYWLSRVIENDIPIIVWLAHQGFTSIVLQLLGVLLYDLSALSAKVLC